jgi:hypothetical protein
MCTCATKVKSIKWRSILGPTNQWSEREKLVQRLFAVVDVSTAQPISLFEIERGYHLTAKHQILQVRSELAQVVDNSICEFLSARIPVSPSKFVRSELHMNRHHVFAFRRKRRISQRWNRDFEIRFRRKLTVLGRVSTFEVIDFGPM